MDTAARNAVGPLLAAAPAQDWQRQLNGAKDVIATGLRACRLPSGLIHAVVDSGDPALMAEVAKNPNLAAQPESLDRLIDAVVSAPGDGEGPSDVLNALLFTNSVVERIPAVRERLAASGHPAMLEKALPGNQEEDAPWSLRLRRQILSSVQVDPATSGRRRMLAHALARWNVRWARAAVTCSDPAMVRATLAAFGGELSRAEQLRAALSLYEHDGAAALASLGDVALRPETADLVRRVAATDDAEALRRAVAEAEGTAGVLEELYEPDLADRAELLDLRDSLDWPAVLAAVRARPLDAAAAAALTARADCPDEVRDACYATQPLAVAEHTPRPDLRLLTADCVPQGRAEAVRAVIRRALGRDVTGAELLANCRPAVAALAEAGRTREADGPAETAWREFTAGLAKLAEDRLGSDLARWRAARALLADFAGSVPELLDAAAAASGDGAGAWPDADPVPADGVGLPPVDVRTAFQTLLDLASFTTLTALRPLVDGQTAQDMLVTGRWRPEWISWALEPGRTAELRLLAGRPGLHPDEIERLAALDDPEVNAALFFQNHLTSEQRRRMLCGRPFGPARCSPEERTTPVPLHPVLLRRLLDGPYPWQPQDALDCADLRLQHHIMRTVYVIGRIPQLRLMLNVWERHGRHALARLMSEAPICYSTYNESRTTVECLLARPDTDAALAELRAEVTRGESAEGQIAAFRKERRDRAVYVTETHVWQWEALLAEHRRAPFTPDVIGMMQRIPGCPAEISAEKVLFGREAKQYSKLMKGVPAADVLAEYDAGLADRVGENWLGKAIDAGRVTWAEALEHGRPARAVLAQLGKHDHEERGGSELSALVKATVAGDPDAWTLALRMLPDFPGPVAELLRTAATAVR
ncbi:hypothetical protein [Marinactinospora rubrisoli]|uniref:Uncharacterized protein n=1 Tax=Marinactinospora rubrisoli TaxID=2715399 RepID=A0ABW2KG13_9ACTN